MKYSILSIIILMVSSCSDIKILPTLTPNKNNSLTAVDTATANGKLPNNINRDTAKTLTKNITESKFENNTVKTVKLNNEAYTVVGNKFDALADQNYNSTIYIATKGNEVTITTIATDLTANAITTIEIVKFNKAEVKGNVTVGENGKQIYLRVASADKRDCISRLSGEKTLDEINTKINAARINFSNKDMATQLQAAFN